MFVAYVDRFVFDGEFAKMNYLSSTVKCKRMVQIRWVQRFKHFQDAFRQLDHAVDLSKERPLSNLEKQGLIQAFEFTHELAWKVLKDYLFYQGDPENTI